MFFVFFLIGRFLGTWKSLHNISLKATCSSYTYLNANALKCSQVGSFIFKLRRFSFRREFLHNHPILCFPQIYAYLIFLFLILNFPNETYILSYHLHDSLSPPFFPSWNILYTRFGGGVIYIFQILSFTSFTAQAPVMLFEGNEDHWDESEMNSGFSWGENIIYVSNTH